jgi:hypothetical protein
MSYSIMAEYNKRRVILDEEIAAFLKHEFTEGETGQRIKKEVEEELEKKFGKKS